MSLSCVPPSFCSVKTIHIIRQYPITITKIIFVDYKLVIRIIFKWLGNWAVKMILKINVVVYG